MQDHRHGCMCKLPDGLQHADCTGARLGMPKGSLGCCQLQLTYASQQAIRHLHLLH